MGGLSHIGSTDGLRRELFPLGFAGEVMVLVLETWNDLALRHQVRHETPITALFRDALRDAYVAANRSWFVTLEDPVTDPHFGTELGRNDLRFYPPNHHGQRVFFTIECKRLRVQTATRFKHLADKYVDDGVVRFVNGQYSAGLPCGGMIGYVMDNNVKDAFASVKSEIESKRIVLKIASEPIFQTPSAKLPQHEWSADTFHTRADGEFVLHHLLLGVMN